MPKKNKKNFRASAVLVIISSLFYIFVLFNSWNNNSQNTLSSFAPLVWGVAAVASLNLLIIAILSFFGYDNNNSDMISKYAVQIAAISLLAIAAGFSDLGSLPLRGGIGQTAFVSILPTLLGFGFGWIGLNWDKMR